MSFEASALPVQPVLKWVGGKRQLIDALASLFPPGLHDGRIRTYVEPFVGGGALFFWMVRRSAVQEFHLNDLNEDLILVYRVLQRDVDALIERLEHLQRDYLGLDDENKRKAFYYEERARFNQKREGFDFVAFRPEWIERAAQVLFLNRTCFNGLFRLNSKGDFNVPFGRHKNPRICYERGLKEAASALNSAHLTCGDFESIERYVDEHTFVYFDPPYRPLSTTSHFTSYARMSFSENDQRRLARFFRKLDRVGAKLMLSNSDPSNTKPADRFFEEVYSGFRFNRIQAHRFVNSRGTGRGRISELVITNY